MIRGFGGTGVSRLVFFLSFKKDWRAKIDKSDSIFWHKRGEISNTYRYPKKMFSSKSLVFLFPFDLFDLFQRLTRAIQSFRSLKRLMIAIQSRSIFLKDQREWFDQGRSFLKIKKIEGQKIEFPTLVFDGRTISARWVHNVWISSQIWIYQQTILHCL